MSEGTEVKTMSDAPNAQPPAVPERKAALELPKGLTMDRLPRSVQHVLSWLQPQDYRLLETAVCHLPITRDMIGVVRFTDTIWTVARNAEHRTVDRITGAEMDRFRERLDHAVKELMAVSCELAARARLTEVQQRYKKLLRRFGYLKEEPAQEQSAPTRRPAVAAA